MVFKFAKHFYFIKIISAYDVSCFDLSNIINLRISTRTKS